MQESDIMGINICSFIWIYANIMMSSKEIKINSKALSRMLASVETLTNSI
jgi:hypothetical protein